MMRVLYVIVSACLVLCSVGCSRTTVNEEWKQPGFKGHRIESVLVIGLPENSVVGSQTADEFVRELTQRGVAAAAGYDIVPPNSSRDAIMARARETGRDAVLVSSLEEKRTKLDVYPAANQSRMIWPDVHMWSPNEVVENKYDVFITFIYEAATGKAVWSAKSDTYTTDSEQKDIKSYVKAMVKRMEKAGLLQKK